MRISKQATILVTANRLWKCRIEFDNMVKWLFNPIEWSLAIKLNSEIACNLRWLYQNHVGCVLHWMTARFCIGKPTLVFSMFANRVRFHKCWSPRSTDSQRDLFSLYWCLATTLTVCRCRDIRFNVYTGSSGHCSNGTTIVRIIIGILGDLTQDSWLGDNCHTH